jgi:phosphatidate cytidylyltransferase
MTSSPPARRSFDWRDLGVRLASAALLVPLALAAVWQGGWFYFVVMAVAATRLSIEWARMSVPAVRMRAAAALAAAILIAMSATRFGAEEAAWSILVLGALAVALAFARLTQRLTDLAFGVIYLGAPILALLWLRDGTLGLQWTGLLFAVTWSADTGAFIVGNLLKGPKLEPRLSPKKTWSGLFGGLLAGTAAGLAFAAAADMPLSLVAAGGIGLVVSAATVAGDLWESAMKRRFGVKDSGGLIPGHGGLLDRVDGLMFAALVTAAARAVWDVVGGGA